MRINKEIYNRLLNNSINFKQNKYHNTKVYYDGYKFDSIKEKNHYIALKNLEKVGYISDLKLQVSFLLLDTIKYNGKTYRKTKYIADFTYIKDNKLVVEDVKSEITRKDKTYRLKVKMLLSKYNDIEFKEIL